MATKLEMARRVAKIAGLRELWQNPNPKAAFVYSRGGKKKGRLTGGERLCGLEGCKGVCLRVRWPNSKITWPCTAGMFETEDGQWQIE